MKLRFLLPRLLARIHRDERGGVSVETILILAAIALPILIYLIKVGWPTVKGFFNKGMNTLETESNSNAQQQAMLSTALLVMLVLIAAATDATQRMIYNWTTYPGILAGLGLAVIGALWSWAAPESAERWQPLIGWLPLSDAAAGFLVCGGLMVICFVFFPVGGGDVKLLTMIGALGGLEMGLKVLLWTLILGGCVGLTVLIWRIGAVTLVKRTGQLLVGVLTLGTVLSPPPQEQVPLKSPIFLGPCAAAALIVAPWFR